MSLSNIVITVRYQNNHEDEAHVYYRGPSPEHAMAEVARIRKLQDFGLGDHLYASIYDRETNHSTIFLYEHGAKEF